MSIRVEPRTDGSWAVHLATEAAHHVVTVPSGYAGLLGCSEVTDAELVRASFAFLLDREPAGSILPRFTLDVIPRYFPEYATELRRYVRAES